MQHLRILAHHYRWWLPRTIETQWVTPCEHCELCGTNHEYAPQQYYIINDCYYPISYINHPPYRRWRLFGYE
jgi:hypothetical protein